MLAAKGPGFQVALSSKGQGFQAAAAGPGQGSFMAGVSGGGGRAGPRLIHGRGFRRRAKAHSWQGRGFRSRSLSGGSDLGRDIVAASRSRCKDLEV
jgi:hypothetical protein